MRFMMFMYPEISEEEWNPTRRGRGGDEPLQRGAAQGRACCSRSTACTRPAKGRASASTPTASSSVTDGPFAEAKEVVGGYWLIQARSKEEAVEWASRCPGENCTVEVRRVFEMEDFPQDVQEAAETA